MLNSDAYLSVEESLFHAASSLDTICDIKWIDSEEVNSENVDCMIGDVDGVIIPGGFGIRGIEGMIEVARYARVHNVPCFGICLGMQIMTIEYARHVLNFVDANSTEFNENTPYPVIDLLHEQKNIEDKGATMRLGAYPCRIEEGTLAHRLYKTTEIIERHRHRYEFNNTYLEDFEKSGLILSGLFTRKTR